MDEEFVVSNKFLESYQWREVRQKVLDKYESMCMCCGAKPSETTYLCVDHIYPRKTHPELALDINNLQILCNRCNHGKGNWSVADYRDDKTFIITKHWLGRYRGNGGSFTSVQLEALGLSFKNLPKKWMNKLIGTRISESCRVKFETGKGVTVKIAAEIKKESLTKAFENTAEVSELKSKVAELSSEVARLKVEMRIILKKISGSSP